MSSCIGLLLLSLCLPVIGSPEASLKERGFQPRGDVSDEQGPSTSYRREETAPHVGEVVTLIATRRNKVSTVLVLTKLQPRQLEEQLRAECRSIAAGKFSCGRGPKPTAREVWVCGRALVFPGTEPSAKAGCELTRNEATKP